jgi:hypothetical protein
MTAWRDLTEELDRWSDQGLTATLWWRDDDAALPDPALDRLLGLCTSLGDAPLALAVIPKTVHEEAAGAILARQSATVIQHGYAHRNHAAEGERKTEFGESRDGHAALDELVLGRRRLEAMFTERFAPILAPPWNRLAGPLIAQLAGAGLSGLTRYGPRAHANPAAGLVQVNCHIDVIDWRGSRGFVGEERALGLAIDHLRARRTAAVDSAEPTGLMSHHLAHDEAAWRFIEDFIAATGRHGAARWLTVGDAFGRGSGP